MGKNLGAHLSIVDGLETIQQKMDELKIKTCEVFMKNQKTYEYKPLTDEKIDLFKKNVENPENIIVDGSYLINLVKTNNENVHEMLYDDLHRCKLLGINKYNMHPGINIIDDLDQAILNVATAINNAQIKFIDVTFLLETMPGTGRDIGNSFDELTRIIDLVENKNKIGVTFDTCNMFVAG